MKKLLTLFVLVTLVVSLGACGNNVSQEYEVLSIADLQAADNVKISFWHAFGAEKTGELQSLIDQFTADYPNVEVELLAQGNYVDLRDKAQKNLITGQNPTMLIGYPDHVAGYLTQKGVISLEAFIADSEVGYTQAELDDFVQAYLDENRQFGDNELYGLPFNKSTEVLIYNKTYFDAKGLTPPTTWDELKTTAQAIKDDTGAWGFAYDSTGNMFITLTRQWGGQYTGEGGELLFMNDHTKEAMEFYRGLYTDGLATVPSTWEENYASTPFKNNLVYMTIGSTAGIKYNVPANGEFEIGVAPIPQKSEDTKAVIQQGTNISIMSNSTDLEKLAAWLLIKHLASPEATVQWATRTGYLPVRISGYQSDAYQVLLNNPHPLDIEISKAANAAYLQVGYMFYDPAFVGSSRVRDEVGNSVDSFLVDGKTVQEALDEAYNYLN